VFFRLVVILSVFLFLSSSVSASYYQCENKWGKKVFSDKPCGNDAKELIIKKPIKYELNHSDDKWDSIAASNKIRAHEREITHRQKSVSRYRRSRDKELRQLRKKKEFAANNLAGANWEVSLSQEMEVVQNKYRGLIESEENEITHLREKIADLIGAKGSKHD